MKIKNNQDLVFNTIITTIQQFFHLFSSIEIGVFSSSEEEGAKKDKYEEKGVDEEKGLRKLIGSDEEESEEEEKKEENKEKEEKAKKGLLISWKF